MFQVSPLRPTETARNRRLPRVAAERSRQRERSHTAPAEVPAEPSQLQGRQETRVQSQ